MARGKLEVVKRIYDAWGRGDFRAGTELFDPHVLLVLRRDFPEFGVYRGPDAIATYMRDLLASYAKLTIEPLDLVEAGDSVVVEVAQRGTGQASGAVTELRYFQVVTFRGDSIIRIESIAERDDALAVVGLRE
jgi:ketosteroid isomerase-like protein